MSYLGNYPHIEYFVIEDANNTIIRFPPVYYTGQWPKYDAIMKNTAYDSIAASKHWEVTANQPRFVLFYQNENLDRRVDSVLKYLPALRYETTVIPSFMDRIIHRINPINANESITIYRNTALIP